MQFSQMNSGTFQWDPICGPSRVWLTNVAPSASNLVFCYHLFPLIIRGYESHSLHKAVVPLVGAADRQRTH